MMLGIVALAMRDFLPGQPVAKEFPAHTALGYAAGVFTLIAGAAVEWRRTTAWAAAALTFYYAFIVVILMNGRALLTQYEFGTYSSNAEQVAMAAAALIIFVSSSTTSATLAGRLTRVGQLTFGVCAVLFGGAHFFYMNMTAPLVPKWLPPSQVFWGYATGVCFIAAGVGILTGVQARLAAILLTVMIACFTPLVHTPMLLADPGRQYNWSESALNLALAGAAWVVADSLSGPKRSLDQPVLS